MRTSILLFLSISAFAQESSPAPASDPRIEELIIRQRALEDQLKAQDAVLQALKQTVAYEPTASTDPEERAPLAGYSEKNFFLRDRHRWFVLVPKGRINVDYYNFLNRPDLPAGTVANSTADQRPRDTLFIRRARIGLAGTIARHIDFRVEADFASVATAGQYATLTDASVVLNFWPYVQLEAGQFYAPFTLENPTSENYTDFMEKSAPVRFVVPTSRETGGMLLGELPWRAARYWVGVFDGDGQNFKNLDNKPAVIGRAFFAPLALWKKHEKWMEEVWFGGSFWWQESTNLGGIGPASTTGVTSGDLSTVSTQAGINLFTSNYNNGTDINKNAIRSHLAPNGTTVKWALELNVPVFRYGGLRAEYMHQSIDVSQYNDVNPGNGNLTRSFNSNGRLEGWGSYVEVYGWIHGDINVDRPGLYQVPHWNGYITPKSPLWALMLAAKYEHVQLDVTGLPAKDPALGRYSLDVFELGGSFWLTRHSRLMANYVMNYLDGNAANITKNIYFKDHFDHELLFRLAVSL